MLAFAESEFWLEQRQPDGATRREHLESVRRQTGIAPPELLEAPSCPEALAYLWEIFCRVCARRQFTEKAVPQAISNAELRAWLLLRRMRLTPNEVDVLEALEQVYLRAHTPRVVKT